MVLYDVEKKEELIESTWGMVKTSGWSDVQKMACTAYDCMGRDGGRGYVIKALCVFADETTHQVLSTNTISIQGKQDILSLSECTVLRLAGIIKKFDVLVILTFYNGGNAVELKVDPAVIKEGLDDSALYKEFNRTFEHFMLAIESYMYAPMPE